MRKIQRISHKKRLDSAEASRVRGLRGRIAGELDEMRARARILLAEARAVRAVCASLKVAREEKGLSLGDIERMTGIDRSALSKLERGERPNVTFETLGQYAAALGKQLVVDLTDAISQK